MERKLWRLSFKRHVDLSCQYRTPCVPCLARHGGERKREKERWIRYRARERDTNDERSRDDILLLWAINYHMRCGQVGDRANRAGLVVGERLSTSAAVIIRLPYKNCLQLQSWSRPSGPERERETERFVYRSSISCAALLLGGDMRQLRGKEPATEPCHRTQ